MSDTIKPLRAHYSCGASGNKGYKGYRYAHRNKPSSATLSMVLLFNVGKIPTHSIRGRKHCPCCMLGEWGVRLKKRTNRSLRRKIRKILLSDNDE